MNNVAGIAANLTKAQAEAIEKCSSQWKRTTGTGKGLYKSAALAPLIEGQWTTRPEDGRYRQRVRLTPLGLAVKAHIQGNSHD